MIISRAPQLQNLDTLKMSKKVFGDHICVDLIFAWIDQYDLKQIKY